MAYDSVEHGMPAGVRGAECGGEIGQGWKKPVSDLCTQGPHADGLLKHEPFSYTLLLVTVGAERLWKYR
jgi:hypothetical protein